KKNKQKPDHTGGKSPEHSKSERSKKPHPEKSETKQKEKNDQQQPSETGTEKVLHNKKEEHSSSHSSQVVNRKSVNDEPELLHDGKVKEKPQSDQSDEDDSFEKFLNRLPEPDEEQDQSPVHDNGILSYSSQTLQVKSGKDRPLTDGKTQWVIGDVTDYSSVSDLHHNILVTRNDMMRNQWMNAPPGQPPKAASLFS
ncbi:hypothetical protein, partial [Halobacillus sp. BBL2006]|uniref:hypothetical protein n=1 Tax=Halobacillus sp. BBL2006 TaxID=1543706 RepID=UPI000541DA7B